MRRQSTMTGPLLKPRSPMTSTTVMTPAAASASAATKARRRLQFARLLLGHAARPGRPTSLVISMFTSRTCNPTRFSRRSMTRWRTLRRLSEPERASAPTAPDRRKQAGRRLRRWPSAIDRGRRCGMPTSRRPANCDPALGTCAAGVIDLEGGTGSDLLDHPGRRPRCGLARFWPSELKARTVTGFAVRTGRRRRRRRPD